MRSTGTENIVYNAVNLKLIEIRSDGSVWRMAQKYGNRWNKKKTIKKTKPHRIDAVVGIGYRFVKIMVNGKQTTTPAHRLVYRHFYGIIPPGKTINHINGNKSDNRPENLELATYSENIKHSIYVLGAHKWILNQDGEENHAFKLTSKEVVEIKSQIPNILKNIKQRRSGEISNLAKKYNVSYQTIWDIVRGRSRKKS